MPTKLFWNWHAMGSNHEDAERLRAQWLEWQPTCVLVMEAGAEADKLQAARPDALVVHRMVGVHGDANDEHMAAWGGAAGYIDHQMKHVFSDRRVIMQFMNEAGVRPGNIVCALEAVNHAHERNQPIAVNLDGLGGPADSDVETMRPLIARMLEINAEHGEDFCYIMHHEYYPNHDPQFHGMRPDHNSTEPHKPVQMHLDPMYCAPGLDPAIITNYANWYVGTYARMIYLFRERYDMDYPPVIIGEFGPDDLISKYKGWRPDPYADDGDQSILTQQQYGDHLLWLMRNVYHPADPDNPYYQYALYVKGLTTFSYDDSGGWHTFDVTATRFGEPTAYELFEILEAYAMEDKMPDEQPNPADWKDYIVKIDVRVRTEPSINAAVVGELEAGEIVMLDIANPIEANYYVWMQHSLGWSAVRGLLGAQVYLARFTSTPDPDPSTEQPFTEEETVVIQAHIAVGIAEATPAIAAAAVEEALKPYRLHASTMAEAWASFESYMIEEN